MTTPVRFEGVGLQLDKQRSAGLRVVVRQHLTDQMMCSRPTGLFLAAPNPRDMKETAMGFGVSLRAERSTVIAWLAIYLLCAAFGVYSTATTAADLIEEERTRSESRAR